MLVAVRAITYAALFMGLLLIYVPSHLLSWSGVVRPATIEVPQVAGVVRSLLPPGQAMVVENIG